MRQRNRQRHQLRRVTVGVAKHHALVAGSCVQIIGFDAFTAFQRLVDTLGNIGRLPADRSQDRTIVGIKTAIMAGVADLTNRFPDNVRYLDISRCCYFAHDQDHAGGGDGLAGDARIRILAQDGIQDRIGHLVADFIRMPFGHRLR